MQKKSHHRLFLRGGEYTDRELGNARFTKYRPTPEEGLRTRYPWRVFRWRAPPRRWL